MNPVSCYVYKKATTSQGKPQDGSNDSSHDDLDEDDDDEEEEDDDEDEDEDDDNDIK